MDQKDSSDESRSRESTADSISDYSSPEPCEVLGKSDNPPSSLTSIRPRRVDPANSPAQPTEGKFSSTPPRFVDPPTPTLIRGYVAESPEVLPSSSKRPKLSENDNKVDSRTTFKRQLLQTEDSSNNARISAADIGGSSSNDSESMNIQLQLPARYNSTVSGPAVQVTQCLSECYEFCDSGSSECSDTDSKNSVLENVDNDSATSHSDSGNHDASEINSESSGSDRECDKESEEECEDMLYPGASHTVSEAVLKIMNLHIRHQWTQECLKDSLKTFQDLLPESNQLPSSVYKLFKYVEEFSHVSPAQIFWYCSNPDCFQPKDNRDEKCLKCESEESSKCFYFSLDDQLKHLFEQRNIAKAMDLYRSCQNTESDVISDISSGSDYKEIRSVVQGPYDVLLLWNTDGVSMSKSSGMQLWPILCLPTDVPTNLRSSFLLVASVWCDRKKPPMNMFLKPFPTSPKTIKEAGGVEWTHPDNGENHKSLVVAPILSADAPATAEVPKVQYFSALHGCNTCEQKRAPVKPSNAEGENSQKKKGKEKTGKR